MWTFHQQTIQTFKVLTLFVRLFFVSSYITYPTRDEVLTLFRDMQEQWNWMEVQSRTIKSNIDHATEGVPFWPIPFHGCLYHFFSLCGYEPGETLEIENKADFMASFEAYIQCILTAYGQAGRFWRNWWNSSWITSRSEGLSVLAYGMKATRLSFYSDVNDWYPIHSFLPVHGRTKTDCALSWITRRHFHIGIRHPTLTERNMRPITHHLIFPIGHRAYITDNFNNVIGFRHCGGADTNEDFRWNSIIQHGPMVDPDSDSDTEVIDLTGED